jgi:hypothetical protein
MHSLTNRIGPHKSACVYRLLTLFLPVLLRIAAQILPTGRVTHRRQLFTAQVARTKRFARIEPLLGKIPTWLPAKGPVLRARTCPPVSASVSPLPFCPKESAKVDKRCPTSSIGYPHSSSVTLRENLTSPDLPAKGSHTSYCVNSRDGAPIVTVAQLISTAIGDEFAHPACLFADL